MTSPQITTSRSSDVRKQARARLLALRQGRMTRRAERSAHFAPTMDAETGAKVIELDEEDSRVAAVAEPEPEPEEVAVDCEGAADVEQDSSANPADDQGTGDDEAEDLSVDEAVEDEQEETTDFGDQSSSEPVEIATDADSDLSQIPGAGPGLIWMLNTVEVRTLEDLAAAQSETLKDALGPVGHILDVDALIAFAQERSGVNPEHP